MSIADKPAFPVVVNDSEGGQIWNAGINIRQYFAAKAMQIILSIINEVNEADLEHEGEKLREIAATESVKMADALIKELEK